MNRMTMAVILSLLCPGLGQIYNKEHRKGWVIIALMTLIFIVPSIWLIQSVAPIAEGIDPLEIQSVLSRVVSENKHGLNMVTFVFLGLWAYSIVQAYFKAQEITEKEADSRN